MTVKLGSWNYLVIKWKNLKGVLVVNAMQESRKVIKGGKMKKLKAVEEPRLGLIDPTKPTSIVDFDVDKEVQMWLNKVSKLSNHTISSVITVLLSVQCINLGPAVKAKKKAVKARL
jgi:hypothetical protein